MNCQGRFQLGLSPGSHLIRFCHFSPKTHPCLPAYGVGFFLYVSIAQNYQTFYQVIRKIYKLEIIIVLLEFIHG